MCECKCERDSCVVVVSIGTVSCRDDNIDHFANLFVISFQSLLAIDRGEAWTIAANKNKFENPKRNNRKGKKNVAWLYLKFEEKKKISGTEHVAQ